MPSELVTLALRNAPGELVEAVLSALGQRTRRMIESEWPWRSPWPCFCRQAMNGLRNITVHRVDGDIEDQGDFIGRFTLRNPQKAFALAFRQKV